MFNRYEITDPHAPPTRQHYPWTEMEEYHPDGGMWTSPNGVDRGLFIQLSGDLMCRPADFLAAMLRALDEWPRSVGAAMTTPGLNRRAWIGHAGCFLATESPEETTRIGWHTLDAAEQYAANAAADTAIAEWHTRQAAASAAARPDQLNYDGGN